MGSYIVLGGSGFVGSYLINYLSNLGHEVVNIDFRDNPKNDLRCLSIPNLHKFDGCFFLAWDVGGAKYLGQKNTWHDQFTNNIAIINNVVPQLKSSEIPFLFVSSQLAGTDKSPYSLTKYLAENYCQTISHCAVARQWNAYGSIEKYDIKSHVISDMVVQAVDNNVIKLLTNGSESRKFIHLDDICDAYLILLNNHQGEIYDVSTKDYTSILFIANIIKDITGATIIRGEKEGVTPSVATLKEIPGWSPKVTIKDGVNDLISQYIALKKCL